MKEYNGFKQNGTWFRGNLHSHTVLSDGTWTPEQMVEEYKKAGYHFLAISDHDFYTDFREQFNEEQFLTIPAFECSAILYCEEGRKERFKVHHLHGILGTSEMQAQAEKPVYRHMEQIPKRIFYGTWDGAKCCQDMVDSLKERGMIVTYNHPRWSRVKAEEFMETNGLDALEIYNYGTVMEYDTGDSVSWWDELLMEGKHINGFASDDNHNVLEDSFGGWIMVQAPELTHDAILQNFLDGNYYSSSGPEIYDWGIRDGKAWVRCSGVNHINFVAGPIVNDGLTVWGKKFEDSLNFGEYQLKGHETYLRIEVVDKFGQKAWTNPVYF